VRLAVSDDHLGLKAAVAKVFGCPWHRCTVHFIRNMHGHCKKGQRNMVSAALREVFNAEDLDDARERSAAVVERLTPTAPKVAALLEAAEEDLLAFYRFPVAHWPKLRSTNNIERVNKEIARRSDVVGIFPNDRSVIRLVGALLIEQNDEWLLTRGYLSKESIALVLEDQGGERKRGGDPGEMKTCRRVRYTTTRDLTLASCRNHSRRMIRRRGYPDELVRLG